MVYLKIVKEIDPRSSHHRENSIFFSLYLHEIAGVTVAIISQYASQVTKPYTLNSAVCLLYLNKTEKKVIHQKRKTFGGGERSRQGHRRHRIALHW